MQITPIGAIAFLLWIFFASRGTQWAFFYTISLIPFGMAAGINMPAMGNLSILILHICAGLTVGLVLLQVASGRISFEWAKLPFSFRVLALLLGYGLVSAFFFPRLFSGAAMVFPLSRGSVGARLSPEFHSSVVRLQPTTGNLSQTFYFFLSAFVFYCAYLCSRKPSTARGMHLAVGAAALLNGILAVLDVANLKAVLSVVRTANYSLLDDVSVAGLPRIIGGFPEASVFGAVSSVFAVYFLVHFQNSRERYSAILAIISVACAAASFSSTGMFGLFVLGIYILFTSAIDNIARRPRPNLATGLIIACGLGVIAVVLLLMVTTSLDQKIYHVLDKLVFGKSGSASGIERGVWADYGYKAFGATWGVGAGLGSIRSNGLIPTMLGSIGLAGTLLLTIFLYLVVARPQRVELLSEPQRARTAIFQAARAGMVISLSTSLASATVPDLGVLFMLLASLAEQARGATPDVRRIVRLRAPRN